MFYHLLRPRTVFPTPANSFSNGFGLNNSFIGRAEMFNGLCFYVQLYLILQGGRAMLL